MSEMRERKHQNLLNVQYLMESLPAEVFSLPFTDEDAEV
jgi:hypothetical protein